jgi:cytochrome c-type biogenesis protein CcmH/NrfF
VNLQCLDCFTDELSGSLATVANPLFASIGPMAGPGAEPASEGGWPSGLVLGASMAGLALVVVGAAVVARRSRRQRTDRAAPLPMAVDDSDAQEEAGSDADESETETLHP